MMSGIKNDSSATSAVLFLNAKGEPMRFFIRPGPTKVQLQPLILHGGGVLCRTQEPNVILLAGPGDITAALGGAGHFYISTQYVRDCVTQNQQLDIESYRFSNAKAVQTRAASRKQRGTGRMGYSPEDDAAILNFISQHRKEAKGNRVWQQMEQQGVTSHSWQSMKDRFLKHLQHKLEPQSPENKKKASPLKESFPSEDNSFQLTPKKTPRKKAAVVPSSDSDSTQISCEHEEGATDLQSSPEKIRSLQEPASEKRQTDELWNEADGDESVPEEERQQYSEELEVSPKRARMNMDTPAIETSPGKVYIFFNLKYTKWTKVFVDS